jgi:uncharacterized protein (UPF0548 family)
MRPLSATAARTEPFDCQAWRGQTPNASRALVAGPGYTHDRSSAPFTGDFDAAAEALLRYQVFAPHRMVSHVCTPDGLVAVGATVVQRVALGPIALETAVQVIEVERTPSRAAFAYATLDGHPERGVASFAIDRADGVNTLTLQAWSRAGHWLAVLGRPVSRALQLALTQEALQSFVRRASAQHAAP